MKIYPPGTLIANRYEVASRPMMGGMGIVYICLDHQENRPVALKTFKPEYLPNRTARDRFLREGAAWVDLGAHPHVVRCYKVEHIDISSEVYLVLELVAKEQGYPDASLRSWLIPGQPLPTETALLFTLQIARGMQHAVERIPSFVHRDLKPENVLVGTDKLPDTSVNRLRVTDFGLAAILESVGQRISESADQWGNGTEYALRNTQLTHGIVGTPLYMAPEQWQGENIGVHTDVYALGCMLVEMVTGQRAVTGNSVLALQRAHCMGDLRPLSPGLPGPLHAFLDRCLALKPADRYPDWEDVGVALVAVYETVTGHPVPPPASVTALSQAERVAHGWSYNAMGNAYLDLGKAEVAVGYFERAQQISEHEGVQELAGAVLGNLGLAYARLGEAQRAVEYHKQYLKIAREIKDRRGEGAALGNLGNAYADLGDARRALECYEWHLTIAREIGDRHGEGAALGNLGNVYREQGEARRASEYYEQYLAIARETGNRREEGDALGNLGLVYADLGEVQRAIGYYEKYLAIAREIGDRRGESNALGNLGIAYKDLGNVRLAIKYHEQTLVIDQEIGNRRGIGKTLGNLGSAYWQLGDVQRALRYYEQQLAITCKIGDRRGEGMALSGLGLVYADLGNAQRAIKYHEQHLTIAREVEDRHEEGAALGNLGSAYWQLEDARHAIEYYEQQLLITCEIEDQRGKGIVLGNLGSVYATLGNTKQAIGYFEQALVIAREINDSMGVAFTSFNMALLHVQRGELSVALPLAKQSADIFTQIGHTQYAQRAKQLVAELLAATR